MSEPDPTVDIAAMVTETLELLTGPAGRRQRAGVGGRCARLVRRRAVRRIRHRAGHHRRDAERAGGATPALAARVLPATGPRGEPDLVRRPADSRGTLVHVAPRRGEPGRQARARHVVLVHGRHRRLRVRPPVPERDPAAERSRCRTGAGPVDRVMGRPDAGRGRRHARVDASHVVPHPRRAPRRRAPAHRAARLRDRLDRHRRAAVAPRGRHPGHGQPRSRGLVPPSGVPTSGCSTTCTHS